MLLTAKVILLGLLGLVAVAFCVAWAVEVTRRKQWQVPTALQCLIGFITDFLDTFGIGSFATTTALYRPLRVVPDEKIPGTLNVGHTIPTCLQAFIFVAIVEVEMTTLILLISASVVGAWLGAGVVARLPRRGIQIGMGVALLAAVGLLLYKLLYGGPAEAGTKALDNWLLAVGLIGCFVIGALMTIGVGAYAPIMIMVSLLGMNPITAFPIMMGACAFLMPVAGTRFIRAGAYDARAAMGLTLAGIPAVLIAAWLVEQLDKDAKNRSLNLVGWLVLVVVLYTAASMLWAAWRARAETTTPGAESASQARP